MGGRQEGDQGVEEREVGIYVVPPAKDRGLAAPFSSRLHAALFGASLGSLVVPCLLLSHCTSPGLVVVKASPSHSDFPTLPTSSQRSHNKLFLDAPIRACLLFLHESPTDDQGRFF